jgi:hypothetical protein
MQITMSQNEMRVLIDTRIGSDQSGKSMWSANMSSAIIERKWYWLVQYCHHGKGFNDGSKLALCEILGEKPVLTAKAILVIIAKHCNTTEELILLALDLGRAKRAIERKEKALTEKFSNGKELVLIVKERVNNGYENIMVHNRKTWLTNNSGQGMSLGRVELKQYAQAVLNLKQIKNSLDLAKRNHVSPQSSFF